MADEEKNQDFVEKNDDTQICDEADIPPMDDLNASETDSATLQEILSELTIKESEEETSPSSTNNEDEILIDQVNIIVREGQQQILEKLKELQESFDTKLKYDAKKNEIIDKQFSELDKFKSGLVEKVSMQIINDLINEIDSISKLIKFYESAEFTEENFKKLLKVLRDMPTTLCDLLEKYGVMSYSSSVGVPFNPKRQRVLRTTETGEKEKDKTVRELLRMGFEKEFESQGEEVAKAKIIRPEMVDVFVFKPELAPPEQSVGQEQQDN